MTKLFLVQRLERQTWQNKTGFDGIFALEYMGRSEFEFGTPNAALKRLRAAGALVVTEHSMTVEGVTRTVFVVSPKKAVATATAALDDWAGLARPFAALEPSLFPEVFAGEALEYNRTTAWWDLGADVAWALDRETAELLVEGFAPPAAS
jgi:hypothetical protein